jgi:general stress protein YciG
MSNQDKGFASMDKNKVKEIAKKGGEAHKAKSATGHKSPATSKRNDKKSK